jgi:hypothetical protein
LLHQGLSGLLNHITEQMLDYPKLRRHYFRLLKRLAIIYPGVYVCDVFLDVVLAHHSLL